MGSAWWIACLGVLLCGCVRQGESVVFATITADSAEVRKSAPRELATFFEGRGYAPSRVVRDTGSNIHLYYASAKHPEMSATIEVRAASPNCILLTVSKPKDAQDPNAAYELQSAFVRHFSERSGWGVRRDSVCPDAGIPAPG